MGASYFDVDGTLVSTNLVHQVAFYLFNQPNPAQSLTRTAKLLLRAPSLLMTERRDRGAFNVQLFEAYRGMSEDRLMELADEAFDTVIRPNIYDEARDLVARAKRVGHRVVLISGSPDFLLAPLAKVLEADDVISNRLMFQGGTCTGKLKPPLVAGPEKARLIQAHAREHGFDLDRCAAYSDSASDVPMLSVVGRPSAVNPDKQLHSMAKTYRWPVLQFGDNARA